MEPSEYLKRPYGRFVVPETDGSFRAEIIEFPGCIATGDSGAEAYANLEEVAASWIEATLARNLRVPDPVESGRFSGKLMVRLPKTLHKKAAHIAALDGVSLNQFIVGSIAEQVGAQARPAMINVYPQGYINLSLQIGLGGVNFTPVGVAPSGNFPQQQFSTSSAQQLVRFPVQNQRVNADA